ncbi:PepSY-associated TM helix domain-containing protein [Longimicrobium sp.]|uniref:PepSY-associated TM helix domain-containing protein n=1 Tax=Longimicrobium sp. TaxID=2029185 RepID=UPI003B3B4050
MTNESNRFYLAAWRWHFYAGLFVVPFLLVLATTGMVMLLSEPVDALRHRDLLQVAPGEAALTPEEQVRRVSEAYPHTTVAMYLPPRAADRSAQVSIVPGHGGGGAHAAHQGEETLTVFVDPYTGTVLGAQDPLQTPYAWAKKIHGTLLLGTAGDLLVEVAAGFAVLLLATGLFLWWPRGEQRAVLWPRMRGRRRPGWRDLHASVGFWSSGVLAFFLLSGLAWTPVWGGRLVQGFSSLPPAQIQSPPAEATHASLNRGVLREVPWALEQTPMPASGSLSGLPGIPEGMPVRLNAVVAFARDNGFTGYRVNVPRGSDGVWTLAAATMSGDVTDPRRDRVMHLDQYTGRVLADYRFPDYPPLGKAMAAGIALHQGDVSVVNLAANVLVCLGVITLCASGVAMWWMRRPAGVRRLAPPPMPRDVRLWRRAAVLMFAVSLAFPLVALTLAVVALLDLAVVSRVPALRTALKS